MRAAILVRRTVLKLRGHRVDQCDFAAKLSKEELVDVIALLPTERSTGPEVA